jgi:hypothetical protein
VRGGIFTSKNHHRKKSGIKTAFYLHPKTHFSMLKNHFLKNIVLESYKLSRTALQVRLRQKLVRTALGSGGEDLRKRELYFT